MANIPTWQSPTGAPLCSRKRTPGWRAWPRWTRRRAKNGRRRSTRISGQDKRRPSTKGEAGSTLGTIRSFPAGRSLMETPLTPLEFMRRARKVHGSREAVVDGPQRFTYAQFCDRCDAWATALASLGVAKGDRVATIAPNTHQHLEQFYAIPQRGAVIVPMNYRLAADDFVYMANHSGATVLCAHGDYLAMIDGVRAQMPGVRHFVALEGRRSGWLA